MKSRVAFYPGSFDPLTNGHLDVLQHAAQLVDKLIVGIGTNPSKKTLFTSVERVEMLNEGCNKILNCEIKIVTFDDLLVNAAKRYNANLIIRGLRDGTDLDYEMQMSGMNMAMEPNILTVFLPASPLVRPITATLVRQIASMNGDVSAFVPEFVAKKLISKFSTP
jgi:pantetheine-phosphate adenylyltransferase